jgi:hypothetical protein
MRPPPRGDLGTRDPPLASDRGSPSYRAATQVAFFFSNWLSSSIAFWNSSGDVR